MLHWFDANRRDLPWRAAPGHRLDPYRIWLSEVMLQQTRVDTIRPYYDRWLERFPTLHSLAESHVDDVLKAWEGLGYYSRARNFHAAVREVVSTYGGRVPDDPETFRSLPGVGRYTAGAVMSIAFDRRTPIVDGNVRRVFARLLDEPAPLDPRLWELAERFADGERPGDLNQSLMELGATVCTPRAPACPRCPISMHCEAFARGTQNERPEPRKRKPLPVERLGVAVLEAEGRLLLVRRSARGRLAGMWEFPAVRLSEQNGAAEAASRAVRDTLGVEAELVAPLPPIRHVFTHLVEEYHPCVMRTREMVGFDNGPDLAWVRREEIARLALPRAQHRILEIYDGTGSTRVS